jgi:DNA-binding MarR family transcriptional regulator
MDKHLKLENQLCFKYYAISKEIIKQYKPLLEPLNLTYTSYITMLVLWEKDGRTIKELGQLLTLDSGTLTPLLKKLEKIGYIHRKRSSEDERKVLISLTKEGQALKELASDIPRKITHKIFGNGDISDDDFAEKIKMLNDVFDIVIKK